MKIKPTDIDGDVGGGGSLPVGGTTGQILAKQSATDGDADWEDAGFGVTTPTVAVRGSSITSSSSSSYVVSWPAGSVAGDRIIITGGHGFALSATPTGWSLLDTSAGTNWNGFAITKILTAADITAGSVTVNMAGAFNGVIAAVSLVGAPNVRHVVSSRNGSGASPRQLYLDGAFNAGSLAILFGSNRNASTNTIDAGTGLQAVNATAASGVLNSAVIDPGAAPSVTYGTTTGTTGDYQIALVVAFPTHVVVSGPGSLWAWHLEWSPIDNEPPSTNYATLDLRNGRPVLDFDTTTQEAAIFTGILPSDYAGGGVQVTLFCSLTSATSGTVGWDVAIERTETGVTDIDSDGFATAIAVTPVTVPGTSGQVLKMTVNISDGANMDGLAAGELFRIRVRRDVANDTATGDAELLRVGMVEL